MKKVYFLLLTVFVVLGSGCSTKKIDNVDANDIWTADYDTYHVGDIPSDYPFDEGGGSQVCAPGEVICTGANTFNRCLDDGSGWEVSLSCPEGMSCIEDGCYTPCGWAERERSSKGCVFYALDLDQADELGADGSPYAIIVSNTDDSHVATVSVERKTDGSWTAIQSQLVAPNTLYTFRIPNDTHLEDTAIQQAHAFRVVSDFPVIAYQFNPIDSADQWSNDASMLLPLHTLDKWYYISSWHQLNIFGKEYRGYFAIVGTADGTEVSIVASTQTMAGGSIPALGPGSLYTTVLNDGDVIQIATNADAADLTGTYIESTQPVAVFGGSECSDIPYLCNWCRNCFDAPPGAQHRENTCAWCDHIEEQMFPLTTWGKTMIASRVPVRSTDTLVEATFWRVIASEDATTVTITTRPGITLRFPPGASPTTVLNKGEYLEFEMAGPDWDPGDALVEADKPVLVVQYIEGQECTNLDAGGGGDPAMILMVPVEQFLDKYIFLTPNTYAVNYVIVIRKEGSTITLDSMEISETEFLPVAGGWEVARVQVAEGVHHIYGTAEFGIISVGYSPYVSYGYPGGLSLEVINPII